MRALQFETGLLIQFREFKSLATLVKCQEIMLMLIK